MQSSQSVQRSSTRIYTLTKRVRETDRQTDRTAYRHVCICRVLVFFLCVFLCKAGVEFTGCAPEELDVTDFAIRQHPRLHIRRVARTLASSLHCRGV